MPNRTDFARRLARQNLTAVERAIALLWYYRETQEFEERTAAELASDLRDAGFPKPNVTRLKNDLRRNRFAVRGRQLDSFQINVTHLRDLEQRYGSLLAERPVEVPGRIIPTEWAAGTRAYIERLAYQINGCYEYCFYDACAALCRRLMESLIIEVYVHEGRHHEIQRGGVFVSLERLIGHIRTDPQVTLGRNTPGTMDEIKLLGDTAAHDRVYITPQVDIDDVKQRYRRMIQELLNKAGIRP